jgi:hypothetical protein|tara:strand:+ start:1634 stop:1921 length:288 start_codon:yes stop_codon:yes gene_type:complete
VTIFSTGDRVRIKNSHPPGHRRTPFYVRGKEGIIERYCGEFKNPEELAYGFDGTPKRELYRVRLSQIELWDEYQGSSDDTLDLEIYDHWLEKVED